MTITTKQKTLSTFILSAILLTSVGLYQQASADSPHSTSLVATFGTVEHPYSDVAESDPGTVAYTNPASLPGGYFDAVEPTYQAGGTAPTPDTTIMVYDASGNTVGPLNIVKGYEEARFAFDGLVPGNHYSVTVEISDMDFFDTFADAIGAIPLPETVYVSGNGVELGSAVAATDLGLGLGGSQTITKTLELLAIADGSGALVVGFNENFVWDDTTIPSIPWDFVLGVCTTTKVALPTECRGEEPGIRVEQISLTHLPDYLTVDKADIETKTDKNEVKLKLKALDDIPTTGAFGYGILPSDGGSLLVATTHGGVLDSQDQVTKDDAVWHTHYADLTDTEPLCDGLAIDASRLTFTSPGEVKLDKKHEKLEIKKAPLTDYRDVNFFGGGILEHYSLGGLDHTGIAVSFTLSVPAWTDQSEGIPAAVCVNNVQAFDAKLKEKK